MSLSAPTPPPSPREPLLPSDVDDSRLVRAIDIALEDSRARSGKWLVCHPGCRQCCTGVFAISQLDAQRLRQGMRQLASKDPERAAAVVKRSATVMRRLAPHFPGDAARGLLGETPEDEEVFEEFANDEPCPALDPAMGTCDLYAYRPITCRIFGPPVRTAEGFGVCELCFQGASVEEMSACEMVADPDDLEADLLTELERRTGAHGSTIIPCVLAENGQPES